MNLAERASGAARGKLFFTTSKACIVKEGSLDCQSGWNRGKASRPWHLPGTRGLVVF